MATINFTMADDAARTLTHPATPGGYDAESEATVLVFAVPSAYSGYTKYIDFRPYSAELVQYPTTAISGTTFSVALGADVTKEGYLGVQIVFKSGTAELHSGEDEIPIKRSINATKTVVESNRDLIQEIVERSAAAEASAAHPAIIQNHTWWVWNPSTSEFVDTGDPASPDAEQLTTVMLTEIATHDESGASHADIREDIRTVEAIARGRATGYVFDAYADMTAWLAIAENVTALVTGDNLYIRDTGVKDYWWDGTAPQTLEAESPDLTDYYTRAQTDAKLPIPITRAAYDAAYAAGTLEADRDYDINEGTV